MILLVEQAVHLHMQRDTNFTILRVVLHPSCMQSRPYQESLLSCLNRQLRGGL